MTIKTYLLTDQDKEKLADLYHRKLWWPIISLINESKIGSDICYCDSGIKLVKKEIKPIYEQYFEEAGNGEQEADQD